MLKVRAQSTAAHPTRATRASVLALLTLAALGTAQRDAAAQRMPPRGFLDTPNASGVLRTITLDGSPLSANSAFFTSFGSNGRTCVSCHVPSAGWTIVPGEVQRRFEATRGFDPIFRTVDGSVSPLADVSTVAARRRAYSMLLRKAVIRVGMPIPPGAEFSLVQVDDPHGYASAAQLSLFRRPLPSTNLRFLTTVMWDGRESSTQTGTQPIVTPTAGSSLLSELIQDEANLIADLRHQANGATTGHAQGVLPGLSEADQAAIAAFEMNLSTAQMADQAAGSLVAAGARGGPGWLALQPFYVSVNDVLGADVLGKEFDRRAMTQYDAWLHSRDPKRAAIARGAEVFNTFPIPITDVGGLNDSLGVPLIMGSCTTCHDTPGVGNHSVSLPINVGVSDASRRYAGLPLYTLRNNTTGHTVQTTDPGRALVTGRWVDIGKFKGPILRGLPARAPYFHNGMADSLSEVIEFYETRFHFTLTPRQRADLIAFLRTL